MTLARSKGAVSQALTAGFSVAAAFVLVNCSCGEEGGALRVSGETGFVRCHARAAPDAHTWTVGDATLSNEGRALVVEGLGDPVRVVGFGGPVDPDDLDGVRDLEPDVVLIVGRPPSELPDLGAPVLLVPGGEDEHPGWSSAADGERVIDAGVYRTIRLGAVTLVVVPGAPGGRYARSEDACGFEEDEDWGSAPSGAVVVSWAGPTGVAGLEGAEAGAPEIASIGGAIDAQAYVFAWPRVAAGSTEGTPPRIGLHPLSGSWTSDTRGGRQEPSPTLVLLSESGVELPSDSP